MKNISLNDPWQLLTFLRRLIVYVILNYWFISVKFILSFFRKQSTSLNYDRFPRHWDFWPSEPKSFGHLW